MLFYISIWEVHSLNPVPMADTVTRSLRGSPQTLQPCAGVVRHARLLLVLSQGFHLNIHQSFIRLFVTFSKLL